MRMWKLPPMLLCDQHLIGEHGALHMVAGSIRTGRFDVVQGAARAYKLEVSKIISRHNEVENEMMRRSMEAGTPIGLTQEQLWEEGKVLASESVVTLCCRCADCRKRIQEMHPGLLENAAAKLSAPAVSRIVRDNLVRAQSGRQKADEWALFAGLGITEEMVNKAENG